MWLFVLGMETQMTEVNKNNMMCSRGCGGTVKYNVKARQRNLKLKSMKSQEKVTLTVFVHAGLNAVRQWRRDQQNEMVEKIKIPKITPLFCTNINFTFLESGFSSEIQFLQNCYFLHRFRFWFNSNVNLKS